MLKLINFQISFLQKGCLIIIILTSTSSSEYGRAYSLKYDGIFLFLQIFGNSGSMSSTEISNFFLGPLSFGGDLTCELEELEDFFFGECTFCLSGA